MVCISDVANAVVSAGYIPKKQHYFARTYGEMCRSALSYHEDEVQETKSKQTQLKKVFALQSGAMRPTNDEEKAVRTSTCLLYLNIRNMHLECSLL